ncbi:MAG: NADH:ubiquinone reductase (Na(+)-transporting) subunit C [Bacteroidota bacterium]|jgi:Na+-transporting NADH:ubiquinone oxidoreductase subunit C|nr:NADH:ubiquinone reductase (Na(+)-transporting) subunit C [Bacteroidota bacterium]
MNRESNTYTILYAVVMVVVVALGLALTHQLLKDRQVENENIDKMQQILRSLNVNVTANEALDRYGQLIQNAYLIDEQGVKVAETEGTAPQDPAFSTELGDPAAKGMPVYEALVDGSLKYVIPMSGAGLWGGIWGYMAIEADGSTIYGAEFDHSGETPGLGAEIADVAFKRQFQGKHLFRDGEFRSVAVVKPGRTDAHRDYVDGISGGTITSQGVDRMLRESVGEYRDFLMKLNTANQ